MVEMNGGRGQSFAAGIERIDRPDGGIEIIQRTPVKGGFHVGFRLFRGGHVVRDRDALVFLNAGENPNAVCSSALEALRSPRGI